MKIILAKYLTKYNSIIVSILMIIERTVNCNID